MKKPLYNGCIVVFKYQCIESVVQGENVETSPASITHTLFKVGDRVKVDLEVDVLKAMQEGHGGWNPRMAEVIISCSLICFSSCKSLYNALNYMQVHVLR